MSARPTLPKPTHVWDVAVVGSDLPGLVAGALLAQRGLRVLHVEDGGGPHYEDGGFRLPRAPELLPAFKALPALHATFDELKLVAPLARAFQPVPLQLLEPRRRTELGRDEELGRSFGPEAGAAAAAIRDAGALADAAAPIVAAEPPLVSAGLLERWSLARLARRHRALLEEALPLDPGRPLGRGLLDLHAFATRQAGAPSRFAFARTAAPLLPAPHRLEGPGLAALLRQSIASRRGDVLGEASAPVAVEALAIERGRFAGVSLRGGAGLFRARLCIAAMPAARLASLLPDGRRKGRLEHLARSAEVRARLRTKNLVLPEPALPRGLGPLALASGFDGGPLLLQVRPALDAAGAERDGLRTVTASAFSDEAAIDRLLAELLPFHERHVRHQGFAPDPGHAHLEVAHPRRLGVEGLPARTPFGRVLLGSWELLPGLGLEGAFLAGRRIAALARQIAGKVERIG